MVQKFISLILLFLLMISCDTKPMAQSPSVKTGAQVLIEDHLNELDGLRVALVMNPTARINGIHMLDTLLALNVNITALFAPEHGFRGEAGAGETILDGIDQATGLTVFSLYGQTRKPTPEMMSHADVILFDMQDVGARFYTYNSTLGLLLEASAEANIPVWLLDRPNPAGGEYVSGWILEDELKSFVGIYPIPIAHGLTLGELGKMMIGESWIQFEKEPEFRVIPMKGWTRSMKWPATRLDWFPPSPNLPTFEHAYAYLGTCLIEGTTLSEGRGTDDPFLLLGAPATMIDEETLAELNEKLEGANVEMENFVPVTIPGRANQPKHEGSSINGIRVSITDYDLYDPVRGGLVILKELLENSETERVNNFLYRLAGSRDIDWVLNGLTNPEDINFGLSDYLDKRKEYLIYN